jgi:predicted transcriptional regulator
MNLLLSIKPEYANKILNGSKRYEFRKVLPSKEIDKVYLYATMPLGKVIGEFTCEGVISDTPEQLWEKTKTHSGITEYFFYDYFKGRKVAHAIKANAVKRYDAPLTIQAIAPIDSPPQSFCYVE